MYSMSLLELENLHVAAAGHPILKGVDLSVNPGEVHLIVGPNGSGKSTLAQTIMGMPQFRITEGTAAFSEADLAPMSTTERAQKGIFLAHQHPVAIPGLPLFNLVYGAYQAALPKGETALSAAEFYTQRLLKPLTWLNLSEEMIQRAVNDDLSGGEKKKTEIFQMLALSPRLAILDEIDSGLDRDAVRVVFEAIAKWQANGSTPSTGSEQDSSPQEKPALIVISHHPAITELIEPDYVHIMMDGRIIASGGVELLDNLEEGGYEGIND